MSFGESITYAFKNYANFYGVTTRRPHWLFVLFFTIVYLIFAATDALIFGGVSVFGVLMLGLLVPLVSSTTRRLRDAGFHWAFTLLLLVPPVGTIILAVLCAQKSKPFLGSAPGAGQY